MKTILYMATSLTGKTTAGQDDTSWVEESDVKRMDKEMIECGAMIMGKKTYESFGDDLPIGKAMLIVMTRDNALLDKKVEGVIFTNESPSTVLNSLENQGFEKVMLAGGEKLNSTFLREELINEVRVILKPLIIGDGKSLFNAPGVNRKLQLIKMTKLENDAIELSYELKT